MQETLSFRKLSVTQFVSAIVYGATFFITTWGYDVLQHGFGRIPTASFTEMAALANHPKWLVSVFTQSILVGIILINAIRYYLSFWSVEERASFHDVRDWAFGETWYTQTGLIVRLEWFLRFSSILVLYFIPTRIIDGGRAIELLLVLFFVLLVLWDVLILRLTVLYDQFLASNEAAKGESRQGLMTLPKACGADYADFKRDVRFWLRLELAGVVVVVLYAATVFTFPRVWGFQLLVVGGLVVCSLTMAVVDVFWWNFRTYKAMLTPLLFWGTIVYVLLSATT